VPVSDAFLDGQVIPEPAAPPPEPESEVLTSFLQFVLLLLLLHDAFLACLNAHHVCIPARAANCLIGSIKTLIEKGGCEELLHSSPNLILPFTTTSYNSACGGNAHKFVPLIHVLQDPRVQWRKKNQKELVSMDKLRCAVS